MDSGLYRIYSDNIPTFSGDEHILPAFIRGCEELISTFQNIREPLNPINKCIVSTIISRLRGKAAEIVCPRTELNTWPLIKQTLRDTFSDGRSLDCQLNDLISTTIDKNETITQFGLKLQTLRSLLVSKLSESNESPATKQVKIDYYEQITLKTYINSLPKDIQIVVKCKSPETIEQAIAFAKLEEADAEFKSRVHNKKQNFIQNRQQTHREFVPNFPRQNHQLPIRHLQNNFQMLNQTKPQFPSGPINIQPRFIPQNFPTNAQTFGRNNNNVFKPQNKTPQNVPTPMSTQSRQPSFQRPHNNFPQRTMGSNQVRQNFPWLQQKSFPKFISQELNNVEDENQLDVNSPENSNENIDDNSEYQAYLIGLQQGYQNYFTDAESNVDYESNENFAYLPQDKEQT